MNNMPLNFDKEILELLKKHKEGIEIPLIAIPTDLAIAFKNVDDYYDKNLRFQRISIPNENSSFKEVT